MGALPQPGEPFGRYDLVRRLGRGGMGIVYAAVQRDLERDVALKVLSPDLADAEEYRNRFMREAKVLARLDSPHVVRVHDAGEWDGWLYIATELLPEGDLATLLKDGGPLSSGDAVDVLDQVAEGLAAAHRQGVLHRDIKPSNVLLRTGPDGRRQAVLCDLGISSVIGEEHTKTAGVIGTLGYMAPERHQGHDATVASDVYALGCLLWACLTGTAPYTGTDLDVMLGHLNEAVPQVPGDTATERRVNEVIARAMAKEPADRYPSAGAFRAALAAPVAEPVLEPTPTVEETAIRPVEPAPESTRLRESSETQVRTQPAAAPTPSPRPQRQRNVRLIGVLVGVLVMGLVAAGFGASKLRSHRVSDGVAKQAPTGTSTAAAVTCWNEVRALRKDCATPNGLDGLIAIFPTASGVKQSLSHGLDGNPPPGECWNADISEIDGRPVQQLNRLCGISGMPYDSSAACPCWAGYGTLLADDTGLGDCGGRDPIRVGKWPTIAPERGEWWQCYVGGDPGSGGIVYFEYEGVRLDARLVTTRGDSHVPQALIDAFPGVKDPLTRS